MEVELEDEMRGKAKRGYWGQDKECGSQCFLLQQGTDLMNVVCKSVTIACLARVACTCRTLRTLIDYEEVWKHHCPEEWRRFGVRPIIYAGRDCLPFAAAMQQDALGGDDAGQDVGTPDEDRWASFVSDRRHIPSEWMEPYASWRSLAIAAYTAPHVYHDTGSIIRSKAASLVAEGRIAHADLLLCA